MGPFVAIRLRPTSPASGPTVAGSPQAARSSRCSDGDRKPGIVRPRSFARRLPDVRRFQFRDEDAHDHCNSCRRDRRRLLTTASSATALTAVSGPARPYLSFAADRPLITHGVQSGDVSTDSGVIWARADRPSRMLVEISTTDSFKEIRQGAFVDALPERFHRKGADRRPAGGAGDFLPHPLSGFWRR